MAAPSDAWLSPIRALLAQGRAQDAGQAAATALLAVAGQPTALLQRATSARALGLGVVGDRVFEALLARHPDHADLRLRAALYALSGGRAEAALHSIRSLLARHDRPELRVIEARALRDLDRPAEAAVAMRAALAEQGDNAGWWLELGDAELACRRPAQAMPAYREALQRLQGDEDAAPAEVARLLLRLSQALADSNLATEAADFSARALSLTPDDPAALWHDLTVAPVVVEDLADISAWRQRFLGRLASLEARLPQLDPAAMVGLLKLPYYLHYHGGDQRPMMARYGAFCHRLAVRWRPELVAPPSPPPPADGRLRVAFVSAYWRGHTIHRLFAGWVRGLDRSRFAVRVVHLGRPRDEETDRLAEDVEALHHWPDLPPDAVCRRLRDAETDVVVFPDLGLSPRSWRVAMLRSAPVQAVAWGHPVTTGLPTLDLFLSSAAMEPPDGADQLTEQILALPGLSVAPTPVPEPSGRARASFGLADDDVVFVVPQTPVKLLPDSDALFARVLAAVPAGRLVVLRHTDPTVTALFARRLRGALAAQGVSGDRLVVSPQLPWADYLALNAVSDVFLDGLTWSGGRTTLEALAVGLVPVTLPGDTMRSRHAAAILRAVGLDELVAEDADAYVRIAARLASDPAERAALAARGRRGLAALQSGDGGVAALAEALLKAVRGAPSMQG